MATATRVHLVRHGEVHNPRGVLYGRLPEFHLSDLGREMAERVAKHFVGAEADIVHIVASPLERAQETAAPTADAFGLDVVTDARVIESENAFEGLRVVGRSNALTRPSHWWKLRNPMRPSWGEPYTGQAGRMLAAAIDASRAAKGREAVIVSHQLPIWMARCAAQGRPLVHDPRKRECSLASVTTLSFINGYVVDVEYSEPCADLLGRASPVPGA